MKSLRAIYVLLSVVLIGLGYAVSQQKFFANDTLSYVTALDKSPVPLLALVWLGVGLFLACRPAEGEAV
jgi:hypothetical protein